MDKLAFLLLFLLSGCMAPTHFYLVENVQEFVLDSYKIRQGKQAILEMQGKELAALSCDAMEEYVDFIVEEDVLSIGIYHPTRKDLIESIRFLNDSIGFRVQEGSIYLPDLGWIEVEGYTLDEATQLVKQRFLEEIKDVEVFVSYKDRLSRKIDIAGLTQVNSMPVDGKIRLYEVLSKCHIPPHANLYSSYLLRDGMPLCIDMQRLLQQGDLSQNIVMQGGDKLYIADPSEATIMVMGEVLLPKPIPLPRGYLSLREALVAAGGIPFTGDKSAIQVIRGNLHCPKIYLLSWEEILHLPNDSLLLMPGDTVYVTETPITKWNRFISQLLPSLGGVETATDVMMRTMF